MFSRKANKLCNQGAWALTVITSLTLAACGGKSSPANNTEGEASDSIIETDTDITAIEEVGGHENSNASYRLVFDITPYRTFSVLYSDCFVKSTYSSTKIICEFPSREQGKEANGEQITERRLTAYSKQGKTITEIRQWSTENNPELKTVEFKDKEYVKDHPTPYGTVHYTLDENNRKLKQVVEDIDEDSPDGPIWRTRTTTYTYGTQGERLSEVTTIESKQPYGEDKYSELSKIEWLGTYGPNGLLSQATERATSFDGSRTMEGIYTYNDKGMLQNFTSENVEINMEAKPNEFGGVDSVKTSRFHFGGDNTIENITTCSYDANGLIRSINVSEGDMPPEFTKSWKTVPDAANEIQRIRISSNDERAEIIKTDYADGVVTDYVLNDGNWQELSKCRVEKWDEGKWVADPSHKGISILDITKLFSY